jgi:hypothetical protein
MLTDLSPVADPELRPLLEAVASGAIEFHCVADPGDRVPVTWEQPQGPVLVMVAAWPSDGEADLPPAAWRIAPWLRNWSEVIYVRPHPASARDYRQAVKAAKATGRATLVLASPGRVDEWLAHLRAIPMS